MDSIHLHIKRMVCLLALLSMGLSGRAEPEPVRLLVRVPFTGAVRDLNLPVHGLLMDEAGREYALAVASREQLTAASSYEVLDVYDPAVLYALAIARKAGAREQALAQVQVLHDDGRRLLLRLQPGDEERLGEWGLDWAPLSAAPLVWVAPHLAGREAQPSALRSGYSPLAADMITRMKMTNLFNQVAQLSGVQAAVTDGCYTNILTRRTNSGTPIQRATQYAFDRFQGLGFSTVFHPWTNGGYSGRNVVATQMGVSSPQEIVLMTAHIDSISPSSTVAPGADDNASGCAAALVAAEAISRYRFDRTVRLVLFTGEEQGLLGSQRYAAAAAAAGDQIVGVLNLDMIGWSTNRTRPPLRIHTRTTSNPGYAADLQLHAAFTNVVALYGLSGGLETLLTADGEWASDHSCFWNQGYPAVLLIEEDYSDFNPYYHSVNDLLSNMNLDYFTHYAQAALGTLAHLAGVVESVSMDAVEIVNADSRPGNPLGVSRFVARHVAGATETGVDPYDSVWTNTAWGLKISSAPYAVDLSGDARPVDSSTIFHGMLSVVSTSGPSLSCSNRLRFAFVGASETSRVYTVRIQVEALYAADSNAFLCVTNLRELVADGGWLSLPALAGLTNGAVYGRVDLLDGVVSYATSNFPASIHLNSNGLLSVDAPAQAGCRIVDRVWMATHLSDPVEWTPVVVTTNEVRPQADGFSNGWVSVAYPGLPATNLEAFFRFDREWLAPAGE